MSSFFEHSFRDHYCRTCGAKMKRRICPDGYSQSTGKPEYVLVYECPDKNMFSLGHVPHRETHFSESLLEEFERLLEEAEEK